MNNPEPSCTDIYEPGLISVTEALAQILSDEPACIVAEKFGSM